jgi:hypothetical protein
MCKVPSKEAVSSHCAVDPTENIFPIGLLSDEMILDIFSFLEHSQLCMIASVNKRFHTLALDPSLWKKEWLHLINYFGCLYSPFG